MVIFAVLHLDELNGIVLVLKLAKPHHAEGAHFRIRTRKQLWLKIGEKYGNFELKVAIMKGNCDGLKIGFNHSYTYLALKLFPPPKFLICEYFIFNEVLCNLMNLYIRLTHLKILKVLLFLLWTCWQNILNCFFHINFIIFPKK